MSAAPGPPISPLPVLLVDPVVLHDGILHLRLGNDRDGVRLEPLLAAPDTPLRSFVPGWTPHLLYSGLAPFLILEFRSQDGARAAWLLDGQLRRLGDKLADLDAGQADALRTQSGPLLRRLVADVLLRPMPVLSREAQAFGQVNDVLRTAIAESGGEAVLPAPRARLIDEIPESIAFASAFGGGSAPQVELQRAHLQAGLAVAFEDRLVAATRDGMLSWPSPVDGRPLRCQGCLYFDDFRFAYRFADITAGLTFYVIAADHYCKAMAVYVPAIDLLVARDAWCKHLLDVYFPPNLARWFINQATLNAPLLVPYLARGARRIASVMRGQPGTHLGHQLWNELSGMEYLLTSAQGAQIPEWIIPGARDGIELWGPIEALFPELRRHVNRDLHHGSEVMPYLYAQGICAVRVTRERVSAELRRRLQRFTQMDPGYPDIRRQALGARGRGAPVVILGLRVENRTLVDITGFFRDVIRLVAQVWPGAILVIDGHNVRETGRVDGAPPDGAPQPEVVIESHGESLAVRSPLAIEREIAAELRAIGAGLDVTIVDTLGSGMATSLAWALSCDCFLSIWGASLAKFRWVCNKPGLVVSSQANLLHRDDLHIYDSPQYMETPTPLLFADPAAVVDDPDALRLVPVSLGNPFFANFHVDHGRVLAQFRGLLNEVMAQPPNRTRAPVGT